MNLRALFCFALALLATGAAPAAYSALTLRLVRDAGAVVYLNGVEVFRTNLPTTAIGVVDSNDGARLKARSGQPPGPSGIMP